MGDETPVTYNFILRAGETVERLWGISSASVPWDMAGWTSACAVKGLDRFGVVLSPVVMQFACVYDVASKRWKMTLAASQSDGVPPSTQYIWDWKLTRPDGYVYVPLAGTVTVLRKAS